ncbi:hypothetical protein Pmar_PMAR027504 [Perkinsus marinus ATCC 50983]|uniref:Uncharacterized protein n=1 Tax=Perkinsus marinus (strain ATCC 50983 / TXsc) TaxID=423536 RepID=C5LUQ1_PERM5|nr:hypothetical protein Pmar_PMAR027504 [Perkinsus marinus ATCC 50983]EEQ99541.1 hypothetical protein Pmar_PMAR027504 [Perkinsus marinus ATCC 50983]|eukprot:XP_002766824.1 hypothetical protein Pmar_PMAR027504 [Perkinsus marinus ATCC 50983]
MGDSGRKDTRYKKMVECCSGNVVIARSELPKEAPPIRDFVVGVGARDREGARRALSMAFALASSTSDEPKGARVYIIYIPVKPWQFGQEEDIFSIGYKSTLLLSSVQDEIARLKVQYPRVKVTLKMGNPTDRNHVQNELLSTAERNGRGGHNIDSGELGSVASHMVDKGRSSWGDTRGDTGGDTGGDTDLD